MKKISVVTPCYNEAESIESFHNAIAQVFETLPYTLEFVFVNDGSTDTTQERLAALAFADHRVKYIEFTGNFGQQAATAGGLAHASGDAVIMMDVDLQHPPALIPEFIRAWEGGADAVFGVRQARAEESRFRSITSKLGGALVDIGEKSGLPADAADFSIMDRSVVDAFKKLPPRAVMTRYQIAKVARHPSFIPFDVASRAAGESKYTFSKLVTMLWRSTGGKSVRAPRYEIRTTNIHA